MIRIENLSFAYADGKKALDGVSLTIKDGEFVLLTGASGSGKTTLVRCLNGLIPNFYGGRLGGFAFVDGVEATQAQTKEMARLVGMVFQDPESMFVSNDVEGEISFGPSCLGYGDVGKALKELGIGHLRKRSLHDLSAGEKQKVAIASVLVARPKVLVLDEPLAELDHESADSLMDLLKKLNEDGMTIILIEQRTERVYSFVEREIVLGKGRIVYDGKSKKNGRQVSSVKTKPGEILVRIDVVSFSYDKNRVFKDFSAEFKEGEVVVLEGPNGSGKTTLLRLIMGFLRPDGGVINVGGLRNPTVEQTAGSVGYVFQNPDKHLFAETVEEEVDFILKNTHRKGDVGGILRRFKIEKYKKSYPRYLSGGEKQRVALASILVAEPKVLLLDEPTRGMDHKLKRELAEYLTNYAKAGNLVIMATHDDFIKSCATRRVKL